MPRVRSPEHEVNQQVPLETVGDVLLYDIFN